MIEAARTEAAPTQVTPLPRSPSENGALLSMIERVARDPTSDLDKLERLMQMRLQIEARSAEQAFDAAMATAQAEMRPVATDSHNAQTRSRYASYEALDRALRPIYTGRGFSLSFNTGPGAPDLHVRVLCHVAHATGHARDYHIDMPADGKGAKGGDVMTRTHATGSAISYGMRYLLRMIFNIAIGGDAADDDGNAAGRTNTDSQHITSEQAGTLRDMLVMAGASEARFLRWARQDKLTDIPAEHYESCVEAINHFKRARR